MARLNAVIFFAALIILAVLIFDARHTSVDAAATDIADCERGKGDTRIQACTRLIRSDASKGRDLDWVHKSRGIAYFLKGEHNRAIADFDKAIELSPGYMEAHRNRGLAYYRMGEYDRAIADFDTAITLDPDYVANYSNRGAAYNEKGDYDQAIEDLSHAIGLNPAFPNSYRHRGYTYLRMGKFDIARKDIERALELKPNYLAAKELLLELEREATRRVENESIPPFQQPKVEQPSAAEPKPVAPTLPLGRRLALVIGNSAYQYTPALANPKNDAADVAAALMRLGFTVIEHSDLTKQGMDQAFRSFAREVTGADAVLFYYAGHAMQFQGLNYLMPIDAKMENEADLPYEMSKLDDVIADMGRSRGVRIAVLDACRNNPLEQNLKRALAQTRGVSQTRGLARVARPEGLLVAYSTQAGNVAEDGTGRNSPFTAAFLRHIETPGLEVGPLFRRVMGSVVKKTGGKQHPELSVLFSGEFYFKPGS